MGPSVGSMSLTISLIALVLAGFSTFMVLLLSVRFTELGNSKNLTADGSLDSFAPSINLGDPCPDLEIVDGSGVLQRLPEPNKRRLLVFLSGSCTSCEAVLVELEAVLGPNPALGYEALASGEVLAINVGPGRSKSLRAHLTKYPKLLSSPRRKTQLILKGQFGVRATPSFCIVDDGHIVSSGLAGAGMDSWDTALHSLR